MAGQGAPRSARALAARAALWVSVCCSGACSSRLDHALEGGAQPVNPAGWSPAAGALQAWLTAFNAGSIDVSRDFAERGFAASALAQRAARARAESDYWMYLNLGLMDLVALDSVSDTIAAATVRQKLVDGWGHVTVRVAPTAPHGILSREIAFFERGPAPIRPAARLTDKDLARDIHGLARRLTDAGVFSGVVLVAHNGRVILQRGYGAARRNPPVANTIETRFQIASVSKMFTAIAIAQLVGEGRLSFDGRVATLLPDYPNRAAASAMTVANLLTHTAGLPEYFASPRYPELRDGLNEPRDYWPLFAADSLRFPPGSQWEYSNSNYIVLGAILERISGRAFRDYITDRVFAPAGMTATTYEEGALAAHPKVAIGYTRQGPAGRDLTTFHDVQVRPAQRAGPGGGGLSTAADLYRFATALLEGKLVSPAMTQRLFTPRVRTEDGQRTLGFEWHEWNGVRWVGHNGFAPGAYDQVDIYPDRGYVVVVLSNNDMSGAGAIAYRARSLLTN